MRCFDTMLLRGGGLPFLHDEMRAGQKGGKGNGGAVGLKTAAVIPYKYEGIIPAEGGKKIYWCEGSKGNKGGQASRAKARSKTFPAIAKAMAEQWG